jgi:plasmid stabilization system protein ParE
MLSAKIALADTAAKQLEAGRLDRAQLQPDIDTCVRLASAAQADHRAAIQALHDLLGKEQRKEFVAALETEMKAARKGHKHGHHAQAEDGAASRPPSLRQAFAELNLSDEQDSRLRLVMFEAFKDNAGVAAELWKSHHGKLAQALEAFPNDDFKVDVALPAVDMAAMATRITPRVLDTAEKMLPVLDATQRGTLAKRMRERARIEPQVTNPTEITPDVPLTP